MSQSPSLVNGFTVYFADNVLVMLMATTAGTLGANLFSNLGLDAVLVQLLGVFVNTSIAVAFYFLAVAGYNASISDESGSGSEADETRTEDGEKTNLLTALHSEANEVSDQAAEGYSHMLQMLPWLIIVPMVNIPVALQTKMQKASASDLHYGDLWAGTFFMFAIYLLCAIFLSHAYSWQKDSGSKCESLPTFLLNSFNHSALSSAGKSLHLLESVTYDAVVGADKSLISWARLMQQLILFMTTWFLLAHCWPRLREDTERDKLFKSILTTITVYTWAFSYINNLWTIFYTMLGHGQLWYWMFMFAWLFVALGLAHQSNGNFYGGPSAQSAAFGLMLCWHIDFGVWWAWAQVMTDIDLAVDPEQSFFPLLLANGAILVALLLITSLVYIFANLELIYQHGVHRPHHLPHKGRSRGRQASRVSREVSMASMSD
eukprot:TRINITY_DN50666_c0_g1_i1.p1 TRINITY_DN50666_c0_g1~~TRINITY_DN50666_c0_g1_i1.p1  ORF type:complete len:432 (+),score=70.59 TRINITY_DN50666_c0_g1_i1:1-1296(+)